jgi:hypothetical protein
VIQRHQIIAADGQMTIGGITGPGGIARKRQLRRQISQGNRANRGAP